MFLKKGLAFFNGVKHFKAVVQFRKKCFCEQVRKISSAFKNYSFQCVKDCDSYTLDQECTTYGPRAKCGPRSLELCFQLAFFMKRFFVCVKINEIWPMSIKKKFFWPAMELELCTPALDDRIWIHRLVQVISTTFNSIFAFATFVQNEYGYSLYLDLTPKSKLF